ncbi:MAG: hypothetical protein K2L82_05260 [Lachnospiraceae bacterium]|nr:hypothetical protein [Lachnospiraceae bacterium]
MKMGREFTMNVQIKKFLSLAIVVTTVLLIIVNAVPTTKIKKVDTSNMCDEIPVKLVSLNPYIPTNENFEIAYVLGDKGNIYVLRCIDGKYDVDLWQPEFWDSVEITDLCVGYLMSYALAIDKNGWIYIWDKEYEVGSRTTIESKKEEWNIKRLDNIPKVSDIFATYNQFVIVTETGNAYRWHPKECQCPDIDEMEHIDVKLPILKVVAIENELLILDQSHVLWSIENGISKCLQKDVCNIVQGYNGFAAQMMNGEIYVHHIPLLEEGYEKTVFADKYEASKIVFDGSPSLLSVSGKAAVVCMDGDKLYRWGRKGKRAWFGVYGGNEEVYEAPVKINIDKPRYYTLIGKDMIYIDSQNNLFVMIQD